MGGWSCACYCWRSPCCHWGCPQCVRCIDVGRSRSCQWCHISCQRRRCWCGCYCKLCVVVCHSCYAGGTCACCHLPLINRRYWRDHPSYRPSCDRAAGPRGLLQAPWLACRGRCVSGAHVARCRVCDTGSRCRRPGGGHGGQATTPGRHYCAYTVYGGRRCGRAVCVIMAAMWHCMRADCDRRCCVLHSGRAQLCVEHSRTCWRW